MPRLKFHYCLTCDRIVHLFPGTVERHFGDMEQRSEKNYVPAQCYGPFTTSTPPELPLDWEFFVLEPSGSELEEINRNALDLVIDLAGITG